MLGVLDHGGRSMGVLALCRTCGSAMTIGLMASTRCMQDTRAAGDGRTITVLDTST